MQIVELNTLRYDDALAQMNALHAEIAAVPAREEVLLFVEHPAVITMGNRSSYEDMRCSPEVLKMLEVDFAKIDRGGTVTVHEPGQIVIYPLVRVDTTTRTVKKLVWSLEEAMIRVAARYGVVATRDPINAGVWVEKNKLGAIGIRVSERVSKHGLAFNLSNTLSTFELIVPCGLKERGVTTLHREIKRISANAQLPDEKEVKAHFAKELVTLLN